MASASKHKSQEKSGVGIGDISNEKISTGIRQGTGFKSG